MDGRAELVRRSRDDGEGLAGLPAFPQPSEPEGSSVAHDDLIRLFSAALELHPLMKAVGYDQAAPAAEGVSERRLSRGSFGHGVDRAVADLRILRPVRHQVPAELD